MYVILGPLSQRVNARPQTSDGCQEAVHVFVILFLLCLELVVHSPRLFAKESILLFLQGLQFALQTRRQG
jgi:hypothetical protein